MSFLPHHENIGRHPYPQSLSFECARGSFDSRMRDYPFERSYTMNLQISGHHLEITPALRDYVTGKLERVTRHFDHVIDVSAILSVEKLKQKAEVTVHVPGKDMHVEESGDDLYAAIDTMFDKLDRQVQKYKQKVQDHHRGEKPGLQDAE